MDKTALFIICLYFLSILSASFCFNPEDQQINQDAGLSLQKRSAIESSNPTEASSSSNKNNSNSNLSNLSLQNQKLLGVNGTGQRKDFSVSTTPTPVLADTITTTPLKQYKSDKKTDSSPEEGFTLDNFDVSEEKIESEVEKNNITQETDFHVYYNSTIIRNEQILKKHWNEMENLTISNMLSHSYRRAMTIKLSFDFPFYGHPVRNVTVATGGFLYTGEHVHSWLAATQYIAPLMANFDTSQSNDSYVKYSDNGTAFRVVWENVKLQDKESDKNGTFTFSATLYNTGNIIFAYHTVPMQVMSIGDDKHPVKVGLSDAYIIDKTIFFARRKTIYEYHRVNFASGQIENYTMIYLDALETCLSHTDCQACTEATCLWCPAINRCSTGTDRKRQEWLHKGCDASKIAKSAVCPKIGEKGNDYKSTLVPDKDSSSLPVSTPATSEIEKSSSVTQSSRINNRKMNLDDHDESPVSPEHISATHHESDSGSVGTALGFIIPIGLILTAVLWVFYAYRNPHTKSGQFLIQYRPSQWGWRRGEAHYTAAVQQLYM